EAAVFNGIYHCDVNVMVHAARRESDTSLFNTKHRANMLAVRALHFHMLFDVRSFDHNGWPLCLEFLCVSKRLQFANDPWRPFVPKVATAFSRNCRLWTESPLSPTVSSAVTSFRSRV